MHLLLKNHFEKYGYTFEYDYKKINIILSIDMIIKVLAVIYGARAFNDTFCLIKTILKKYRYIFEYEYGICI